MNIKKIVNYIKENSFFFAIFFFMFFIILIQTYGSFQDNDQWFILHEGKEIYENHNLYKYTSFVLDGYSKLVQQWGYAVLTYLIHSHFGFNGLYVFVIIQLFLLCFSLYKLGDIVGVDKRCSLLIIGIFLIFADRYINIRPEMITWTLLITQLAAIEKYKKNNEAKYLYILPIITLIEVNVHCGLLIFHFLFIMAYIFPQIKIPLLEFKRKTYKIKPLIKINIIMLFTSLINPYTYNAVLYLFCVYKKTSKMFINEMQPPKLADYRSILIIAGIYLATYMIRKKQLEMEIFYLEVGTFILSLVAGRNIIMNQIIVFLVLSKFISSVPLTTINSFFTFFNKIKFKLSYMMLFIIAIAINFYSSIDLNKSPKDSFVTPIKAVDYLYAEGRSPHNIKVYTDFNNGAYVEYSGFRIYMTASSDMCQKSINKKDDFCDEYFELNYDVKNIESFINKYNFDYYLCFISSKEKQVAPHGLNYIYFEKNKAFKKVMEGNGYAMYKKSSE